MNRFKPLIVTSLLVALLYSGSALYISIILLIITVAITYVCFTLNTQLRLEKFIAYLIRFSFQEVVHPVATMEEVYQSKHNRLKTLPTPFRKISEKFVKSIINDFIKNWYIHIGPNEADFLKEVKDALESIVVEVYIQLKCVDIENVVINLIRMFQRHIKVFDDCRNIVQKKYSGISDEDLCNCITELYEAGNIRHLATRSKGVEIDYLKALLDIFLFKFLPENAFSCEGGRFMLREILTTKLLEPLVKDLTDSHFVNQALVDILEPSMPLPLILDQWRKVLNETDEEENFSFEEGEASSPEIDYVSGLEENKCKQIVDQSVQKTLQFMQKTPTASLTKTDNNQSKKEINDHPKKELNNHRNKELIRFDKLDIRTSAPVYGSVSVRDHEKPKEQKIISIDPSLVADMKNKKSLVSNAVESTHNKQKFSDSEGNSFQSHEKSIGESFHTYNSLPSKEVQWPSTWTVCPSSDASVFRKSSFTEMSRIQDDLSEQMKAKLSHMDLPGIKPMAWLDNVIPGCIQSTDIDIKMELETANLHNVLQSPEKDECREDSLNGSVTSSQSESISDVNHDCSADQDPSSCPLCIEMTLMASPFEIDKEKVIFNPKKNLMEHECGLNYKHFYYAETETAVTSGVPLDDHVFASCEDLVTEPLNLSCSPNSDESSLNSTVKHDSYDLVSSHSNSLSNSDYSPETSVSFVEIDEFPSDEEFCPIKGNYNKNSPSIITFKTAMDHSSTSNSDTVIDGSTKSTHEDEDDDDDEHHNHDNDNDSDDDDDDDDDNNHNKESEYINTKLKTDINKSNNKFINFFKGFHPLSKKRRLWLSTSGMSKISKSDGLIKRNRSKHYGNKLKYNGKPSSLASTTQTKFISIPDNSSSLPTQINSNHPEITEYVEEVALEALEDDEYFEPFPCIVDNSSVDPLSKEITVTAKGLPGDSRSSKSGKSIKSTGLKSSSQVSRRGSGESTKEGTSKFLQLFEGEVIKPHPGKIPAAWLYPIQMVSIPLTEIAVEKGWERGINKYTLYSIHYDIRIWPDVYQKHLLDATVQSSEDSTPLIREIKRRYREFLFLHNRFTHGPLSKNMKGILRPNRRYAMPFGRMDPDVIEGRRRILETYLVSVVSRPELCNSREFKEFLGSENHKDVVVVKPTTIAEKQMCDSQIGKIIKAPDGQTLQGHKEQKDSQYFIHGYDVQRMFGYADSIDLKRNMLLQYFVEHYESIRKSNDMLKLNLHISHNEPIQMPYSYSNEYMETKDINISLGPRTAGDGAEVTDQVLPESQFVGHNDDPVKKLEEPKTTSFSVIAAKFSPELASQLEKENLEMSIAREKDLYESSWPLTDAVLSIVCQAIKGYGSWISFERVQQAILFSIGGVIEWVIKRELGEFTMKERWYKYFSDLYSLVWNEEGILKERKGQPTKDERDKMKEQALTSLMEIIPRIIMMSIGPDNYRKGCENLLHTLQYQAVNRHLLFAALEIILFDLIPDLQNGFPEYTSASLPTLER